MFIHVYKLTKNALLIVLLAVTWQVSNVYAIPRELAKAEPVSGAQGLIYGGANGYQWTAIKKYKQDADKLRGDAWEGQIVHVIEELNSRMGLRSQEKLNTVLELIADRYQTLSREVVYNMLVNMVYSHDRDGAFKAMQDLKYNDVYAYIKNCRHDAQEGIDAVKCD